MSLSLGDVMILGWQILRLMFVFRAVVVRFMKDQDLVKAITKVP